MAVEPPSRFIDELPEAHVESRRCRRPMAAMALVLRPESLRGRAQPFSNTYATPGWQRAKAQWERGEAMRSSPHLIEGQLVARESEGQGFERRRPRLPPEIRLRPRHPLEGNKLTVDFDKAGEKRVIDSFVTAA